MAKRGITMVGYYDNLDDKSINFIRNNKWNGWKGSKQIDVKENSISDIWKALKDNIITAENFYRSIKSKYNIRLRKIDVFECNNNIIDIKSLYDFDGDMYCLFLPKTKEYYLLTVGAKIEKEFKLIGYDKKNFCLPLIIGVDKNNLISILNPL
jgi:hypothetical protein